VPIAAIFERPDDRRTAFVAGLLVGEGSFTGDAHQPHCALKMTARHEQLLRLVHSWYPLSRLYGPYKMPGNRQDAFMILWRGPALAQLIKDLEAFHLENYCPHVYRRMMVVKTRMEAV
jgi:hypothetical protein